MLLKWVLFDILTFFDIFLMSMQLADLSSQTSFKYVEQSEEAQPTL